MHFYSAGCKKVPAQSSLCPATGPIGWLACGNQDGWLLAQVLLVRSVHWHRNEVWPRPLGDVNGLMDGCRRGECVCLDRTEERTEHGDALETGNERDQLLGSPRARPSLVLERIKPGAQCRVKTTLVRLMRSVGTQFVRRTTGTRHVGEVPTEQNSPSHSSHLCSIRRDMPWSMASSGCYRWPFSFWIGRCRSDSRPSSYRWPSFS